VAIRSFGDKGTADIANQLNSKAARKTLSPDLHGIAFEKLILLDASTRLEDLAAWPSLQLEKLKGNRKQQHSIRINDRYRICFLWSGSNALNVEIVDYH
jgi:proteic killer suppression protein